MTRHGLVGLLLLWPACLTAQVTRPVMPDTVRDYVRTAMELFRQRSVHRDGDTAMAAVGTVADLFPPSPRGGGACPRTHSSTRTRRSRCCLGMKPRARARWW